MVMEIYWCECNQNEREYLHDIPFKLFIDHFKLINFLTALRVIIVSTYEQTKPQWCTCAGSKKSSVLNLLYQVYL